LSSQFLPPFLGQKGTDVTRSLWLRIDSHCEVTSLASLASVGWQPIKLQQVWIWPSEGSNGILIVRSKPDFLDWAHRYLAMNWLLWAVTCTKPVLQLERQVDNSVWSQTGISPLKSTLPVNVRTVTKEFLLSTRKELLTS
jgi:hypothetical protein